RGIADHAVLQNRVALGVLVTRDVVGRVRPPVQAHRLVRDRVRVDGEQLHGGPFGNEVQVAVRRIGRRDAVVLLVKAALGVVFRVRLVVPGARTATGAGRRPGR